MARSCYARFQDIRRVLPCELSLIVCRCYFSPYSLKMPSLSTSRAPTSFTLFVFASSVVVPGLQGSPVLPGEQTLPLPYHLPVPNSE